MAAKPTPLTRERILHEAAALADDIGIDALSMRKLGQQLGVEAMSLYNHITNKDDLLDGLLDLALAEIALPALSDDWKTGMRTRAHSARDMFLRHPWALQIMETRTNPGPATLRYYDSVIACLRQGGFSMALTAHAFAALDSYIYGFALQELKLPFETGDELVELASDISQKIPDECYPHFSEMLAWHASKVDYRFGDEFSWGLELLLNGLEQAKHNENHSRTDSP